MQSYFLKRELGLILQSMEEAKGLHECINKIRYAIPDFETLVGKAAEGGAPGTEIANQLRRYGSHIKQILEDVGPRKLFASIERLTDAINRSALFYSEAPNQVTELKQAIDKFSEYYEAYITSYSSQDAITLVIITKQVAALIDGFTIAARLAYASIDEDELLATPETQISIFLPEQNGVQDFADKLNAIYELYELFSRLLHPKSVVEPLTIKKIESGSFWAKFAGDSKVIGLIVEIIRKGASFLYRNYTHEGKINAIPGTLEKLNSILEFSDQLKKRGIDTADLHEELRLGSVTVAKSLNTLLNGQREIVVNNKAESVALEMERSLKLGNVNPRLTSGTSNMYLGSNKETNDNSSSESGLLPNLDNGNNADKT